MLSLFHVGHNYWHPIIATSFSQGNSSEFSPIMPEEFGEHLTRDQRPFSSYRISPDPSDSQLHDSASSLQFTHSFSVGFRSEDRDSNGKRLILCSVTHFCVYFDVCFGLLSCWKIKTRAVVLESGFGLESGLETFFYRLGLVLDSLVFGLGLVSDLVIGLAKCSSWSRPSPAIYAFFFLFQNKTINLARLFRKWAM